MVSPVLRDISFVMLQIYSYRCSCSVQEYLEPNHLQPDGDVKPICFFPHGNGTKVEAIGKRSDRKEWHPSIQAVGLYFFEVVTSWRVGKERNFPLRFVLDTCPIP